MSLRFVIAILFAMLTARFARAQDPIPPTSSERIVTAEEVREAIRQPVLPLRIISYPHRVITNGMKKGLTKFEQDRMRERLRSWKERLTELGIQGLFGGLGEGTGFGGGGSYTLRPSEHQSVRFLARTTLAHYQEGDLSWTISPPKTEITFESSYQWRPRENFYGLGHHSQESDHANFALKQGWAGVRVEFAVPKHFRWGAEHRLVSVKATGGRSDLFASTTDVFPNLPGFDSSLRLRSEGAYVDADFSQGEYGWTGKAHISASYQQGIAPSRLRYFSYEWQLEGRMPVIKNQSGLVGQFTLNLNHENAGSDSIPFFMRPRIGGSSTLRGFALDRFYGKNLALMSLEYRYRIHPNFQSYVFHDAGQIFDRTGELTWLNWHRNYGLGIRLHSNYRTIMRLEYGHSRESFDIHLIFGDRAPQQLGDSIRYGTYRR